MPFLHAYLRFGDGLSMEKSDGESVGWPPPPPPPPPLLLLLRLPRGNADRAARQREKNVPLFRLSACVSLP
jgi:hypothetical protein